MDVFLVIAPSIISGVFAVMVCQISQAAAHKDQIKVLDARMAVFEAKFDALKEAVDKHNELVNRVFKVEETTAIHDQELKHLDRRVSELEHP